MKYRIVDDMGNGWDAGMTLEMAQTMLRYLTMYGRVRAGHARIVKVG